MKKSIKITTWILGIVGFFVAFLVLIYTTIIPALITNTKFQKFLSSEIKKSLNLDVVIENPVLKTGLTPKITFSVENLNVNKETKNIANVKNFTSEISLRKILAQKIIVKKITADKIFVDVDQILAAIPKEDKKEKTESKWSVDISYTLLTIKDCLILYSPNTEVKLKIVGKNLEITDTRNPKYVRFDLAVDLIKGDKTLSVNVKDNNRVYFDNRTLVVKDCDFKVNNSTVLINYVAKEGSDFKLNLKSDNFKFEDIASIITSNIIMPSGNEMLTAFDNIRGDFSFDFNILNDDIKGKIKIKKLAFNLALVQNMPINFYQGIVEINKEKILLWKLRGYYGKDRNNRMIFNGKISDYAKDMNAKIEGYVVGTKELTKDYISPMMGIPVELVGYTVSKIKFNMLDGKMDIAVIFRLLKNFDILVDGTSFTPTDYERAFRADMTLAGPNFELKNLNYYIANSFKSGVVATPLLKIFGNFDLSNMNIKNLGFEITRPLPSEFFNLFIGQKFFRKGKIGGNFEYIATSDVPYLDGDMTFDEVRIPSQRFSIKKGSLYTNKDNIVFNMDGRYRRTDFAFDGLISNKMLLPVVVKKADLNVENLDIERILASMQRQQEREAQLAKEQGREAVQSDEANNEPFVFTQNLLVIENSTLNVRQGMYKNMKFGNVNAVMTLDKNGKLDIKSNRFDIAEGISTLLIACDLLKQKYTMRLGLRDVNADIIATSLLNLKKEISGKARCLLVIDTDSSMKLNGSMKFDIKDGTIAKVGLIEYALNFVSLFRNPLAMISPTTFVDLVNVPEGNFSKIEGTIVLKDNSIDRMMITSQAPQLSSFIVGRYDLEKSDAILRIYTKFSNKHKGMAGFFRNISLNSLANTLPLSNQNDTNYYAAELKMLPEIDAKEKDCQVFLTKIDGDVEKNNFLSTLKRIK